MFVFVIRTDSLGTDADRVRRIFQRQDRGYMYARHFLFRNVLTRVDHFLQRLVVGKSDGVKRDRRAATHTFWVSIPGAPGTKCEAVRGRRA